MQLTASVFLAGALLSCLLPISLLIAFATFFYRQTRKLPANARTRGGQTGSVSDPGTAESPAAGPPAAEK